MIFEHKSKNKITILIISLIFLFTGVFYLIWMQYLKQPETIFCTQDAKLCLDGSYVGRIGPNCEFAACPDDNWKTFTDKGVSFRYPEKLSTKYIHEFDWPPQIMFIEEGFECAEGGSEITRAGETKKEIINNREYCVTKAIEGAAGSTYTQYAYATAINNNTIVFTFSIKAVQCGNYDDPEKTNCEKEQANFDINNTIDQIFRTLNKD